MIVTHENYISFAVSYLSYFLHIVYTSDISLYEESYLLLNILDFDTLNCWYAKTTGLIFMKLILLVTDF